MPFGHLAFGIFTIWHNLDLFYLPEAQFLFMDFQFFCKIMKDQGGISI
jgi:hypothetical protein